MTSNAPDNTNSTNTADCLDHIRGAVDWPYHDNLPSILESSLKRAVEEDELAPFYVALLAEDVFVYNTPTLAPPIENSANIRRHADGEPLNPTRYVRGDGSNPSAGRGFVGFFSNPSFARMCDRQGRECVVIRGRKLLEQFHGEALVLNPTGNCGAFWELMPSDIAALLLHKPPSSDTA